MENSYRKTNLQIIESLRNDLYTKTLCTLIHPQIALLCNVSLTSAILIT